MTPLALAPGEVHLWHDLLAAEQDDARRRCAQGVVSADEWEQCARFVFDDGRRECLAARYLVRTVLSYYADVPSSAWQFETNAFGRPRIAGPAGGTGLRFNLSHASGMVVCVVSAHHEVGVDVEWLGRRTPLHLAASHFSAEERAALDALPVDAQPRRFLEYWTLKEAYIKARGEGLSLPLDQFTFDTTAVPRPTIHFADGFPDTSAAWQFERVYIGAEHMTAVAIRTDGAPPVQVVTRPFAFAAPGR